MARSIRVGEFDVWRPGYAGKSVSVVIAGTTTPASLFSDPGLSIAVANPQTLQSMTDDAGTSYGKWTNPIYVGTPYQLIIDADDTTGIQRLPFYDLAEVDLSDGTVIPEDGTEARTIAAAVGDVIRVPAYGELTQVAASNNTILTNAIGAASARGGGEVWIPPGNWPFTQLTIPANVILLGDGRGVTTFRSQVAGKVLTLGGDRAGLRRLTLDGVSVLAGSIGVYGVGRTEPIFDDAEVKRFEIGIQLKGGDRARFWEAFVSNCTTGCDFRGDQDTAGTNLGGPLRSLFWKGGKVDLCTSVGVLLNFIDKLVQGISFHDVEFLSNGGTAIKWNGARQVMLRSCRWNGNTKNIEVQDDANTAQRANNTVRLLDVVGGRFTGGENRFNGTAEKVRFIECHVENVSWNLTTPTTPIILRDCYEDASTTATGDTTKMLRQTGAYTGKISGVTTDATATTAWSLEMDPGETCRIKARIIGRQRDGVHKAGGEIHATATRAGADISFGSASATPSVGSTVTGGTSGASARIVAVSGTTSGTLTLRDIVGTFQTGETLTTSAGQTMTATSGISSPSVTVHSTAAVGTDYKSNSNWAWAIDASASLLRVRVTGDTAQIVEWSVEVDAMRP